MSAEDERVFGEAYNEVCRRWTGNLSADLEAFGFPTEFAITTSKLVSEWSGPQQGVPSTDRAIAFAIGLMTGAQWEQQR